MKYHHLICALLLIAAGFCFLTKARGDSTTQPADPAEWNVPDKPPPFREMIKGDAWNLQFGKALDELGGIDDLMKSDKPSSYGCVDSVNPGSQAEKIGLLEGNLITQIDGKPIGLKDLAELRQNHDHTLTFVDEMNKSQTATVHAGVLGITETWGFNPEIFYLREGTRNASWDEHALVGIGDRLSNPDVAETAWYRAINAGYVPDFLSMYSGMKLAMQQGRPDAALAYGTALQNMGGPSGFLKNNAYDLSLANFKMEQALAMHLGPSPGVQQLFGDAGDLLQSLLDRYRQLPASQRQLPSPREMAQQGTVDLLPHMVGHRSGNPDEDANNQDVLKWLADKRVFDMNVPGGKYNDVVIEPRDQAPDVQMTVHADLKPSDNTSTDFARVLTLSLVNCDDPQYTAAAMAPALGGMVGLDIYSTGSCEIIESSKLHTSLESFPLDDVIGNGRNFTVQIFHAAGRDEIWIDHRRLLYLPSAEDAKKVGFRIACVGLDAHVQVDFLQINRP